MSFQVSKFLLFQRKSNFLPSHIGVFKSIYVYELMAMEAIGGACQGGKIVGYIYAYMNKEISVCSRNVEKAFQNHNRLSIRR